MTTQPSSVPTPDTSLEPPPSRRRAAVVIMIGGYANIGLNTILGFALTPLYLHYIGVRLYGAWAGSGEIVTLLSILDLGLAALMIQRMADAYGSHQSNRVAQYLATGLLVQVVFVLLLVLLAWLLAPLVPVWMELAGAEADALALAFLMAAVAGGLSTLSEGIMGFALALQEPVFASVVAVVATVLRAVITVVLLLAGCGLLAIPVGFLVRSGLVVAANGLYAIWLYRTRIKASLRPTRAVLREYAAISPAMFVSRLGNIAMDRSSVALVAIFLKPELAAIYSLTRRAADVIRMVLDRFAGAVFPGFAHLVGSGNHKQAVTVLAEASGLYRTAAVLLLSAYIAGNRALVTLWVGPEQFGGYGLTVLIGLSVWAGGRSGLLNYLYGATGQWVGSSILVLLESVVRLPLLLILLVALQLYGPPVATLLTAVAAGTLALRLTQRHLTGGASTGQRTPLRLWMAYGAILLAAAGLGTVVWATSWGGLLLGLGVFVSLAGGLLAAFDPYSGKFIRAALRRIGQLLRHRRATQV